MSSSAIAASSSSVAPTQAPMPYGTPISLEQAKRVSDAAEAYAAERGWPMVIAIVDSSGHLVTLHKMDQAQYGSIAVAQAKAETALNFRRATKVFEDAVAAGGIGSRLLSMDNVAAVEGGLPLVLDGCIVGAIGVSGMQASQDGQVAQAAASAL